VAWPGPGDDYIGISPGHSLSEPPVLATPCPHLKGVGQAGADRGEKGPFWARPPRLALCPLEEEGTRGPALVSI
jgi:hypothetical protein